MKKVVTYQDNSQPDNIRADKCHPDKCQADNCHLRQLSLGTIDIKITPTRTKVFMEFGEM